MSSKGFGRVNWLVFCRPLSESEVDLIHYQTKLNFPLMFGGCSRKSPSLPHLHFPTNSPLSLMSCAQVNLAPWSHDRLSHGRSKLQFDVRL